MKITVRLSLALLAIVALLLTSCTPATPPEPTAAPTEAPTEVVVEPTAEPTAEAVTIEYWSMWNETELQGEVINQAVSDFMAAYPNITVNVTFNGRTNRELVGPAIEGGTQVDVFDTGDEYIFANLTQYTTDLESLLDDAAIGVEGKTVRQTLIESLLYNFPVDGKAVMAPYQPYAVLFFYNRDHFTDAGITAVPATFDELMTDCQALVDAGHPCITTDPDAYMDILWGYSAEREFGGCAAVGAAMADTTGELWRDPKWLDAAQKMASFTDNGYLLENTESNLFPAGQQALALGDVTMYLNGTWLPTEVLDTAGPDFPWGSFSFPNIEGGAGSSGAIMMGSQDLVLVNGSANPEAAWLWIKWMLSEDVQQAMSDVAGVTSSHVDVIWPAALAEAQTAVMGSALGITWGCDVWTSEVGGGVVLPAFQQLFFGQITPDEYIEALVTGTADFWASQE
jgi:raffinose/stachyose/melibiose transport system substrate-binding protein